MSGPCKEVSCAISTQKNGTLWFKFIKNAATVKFLVAFIIAIMVVFVKSKSIRNINPSCIGDAITKMDIISLVKP